MIDNPLIPKIFAPHSFFISFSYVFNGTVITSQIICKRMRGVATCLLKWGGSDHGLFEGTTLHFSRGLMRKKRKGLR
jgi:hypothetical protein